MTKRIETFMGVEIIVDTAADTKKLEAKLARKDITPKAFWYGLKAIRANMTDDEKAEDYAALNAQPKTTLNRRKKHDDLQRNVRRSGTSDEWGL